MSLCRISALGFAALHALAATATALEWKTQTVTATAAPFQATLEAAFEFKNTSGASVSILDVRTNCDCLSATASRNDVPPGASGTIKANFAVGDRAGLHQRSITVMTDEPVDPVRLSLQVEVPEIAVVAPRSVAWQLNEAVVERSVDLRATAGLEIIFTDAKPTGDGFAARLETIEAGRHYRVHLQPLDTKNPASVAIRIIGKEKSGRAVIVSAYASVQ